MNTHTSNDHFCGKCGQNWAVHNDDGSCIDDEALDEQTLAQEFKNKIQKPLDPGAPSVKNPLWMSTDFGDLFPSHYSCYDMAEVLEANNVLPKAVKTGHEHSCCFFYFSTRKLANRFCDRLAKFFVERSNISKKFGLC